MLTCPFATQYIGLAVVENNSQILFSEEYAGAYGRSDNRFYPGDREGETFKDGVQAFLLNQRSDRPDLWSVCPVILRRRGRE
ncbi:MAG: hypothetical protein VXZ82_19725 [Planctomycetota bacterium]|nr:hypothetical protein [Planctomycetota bacterium]